MLRGGSKGFIAGAAIGAALRVMLSSGKLALCAAADEHVGYTETVTFNADETQTVRLRNAEGTVEVIASGAIAADADVFGAADGKAAASGTVKLGTALHAVTADGDVLEILPV